MGIRKVGTPQEEKETYRAREAAKAKRAKARAAKNKRCVKQYGSVGAGSLAETSPKGGMINRGKLSKKEWDKIEAAKKRGAAALKRAKAAAKRRKKGPS